MGENKLKVKMLMALASFFWAGAFVAGKYTSGQMPPVSLTFFRMFFAFLGICVVRFFIKDKGWKINKEDIGSVLLMALTGMVGYHVLFFVALKYTTATNTSIIAAINPIITMVVGVIFFKDKIKAKNLIALALSFFGIMIVLTDGDFSKIDIKSFGDLIMLIAVVLWVIYSYISKSMLQKYNPLKLTTLIFAIAAIVLFPFTVMEAGTKFNLADVSKTAWVALLYMAIFPSVIGYLIQQMSIKEIGPMKTAQFVNLVPVFSMGMASVILYEPVGITQFIAFGLVFLGIILNNSK